MKYNPDTDTERYYDPDGVYSKDVKFSNAQLCAIRYGLENGIDVSVYANPEVPAHIMRAVMEYMRREDTSKIKVYTRAQVAALDAGKSANLDTTPMESPKFPIDGMNDMLLWLAGEHQYRVRYTTDGGETVREQSVIENTKAEALLLFNRMYSVPGAKIIDIREPLVAGVLSY